jgi:predicted solute-binding protein
MNENLLQMLIESVGEAYLNAERQAITQAESAVPVLQDAMKNATPLTKLIIQVVLERISGNQTFEKCLNYFDEVEQRTAKSIIGTPPPDGVSRYLWRNFQGSLTSLLSVYLIKLNSIWANWKVLSVLLYLDNFHNETSADVLLSFISRTNNERYLNFAVESLVEIGDVSVLNKIISELKQTELTEVTRNALKQSVNQIQNKLRIG